MQLPLVPLGPESWGNLRWVWGFFKYKLRACPSDLVGMGTSVIPDRSTAGVRRTKATRGWWRKSSSPTSTLDASAPLGIFFMKCSSAWAGPAILTEFPKNKALRAPQGLSHPPGGVGEEQGSHLAQVHGTGLRGHPVFSFGSGGRRVRGEGLGWEGRERHSEREERRSWGVSRLPEQV